MDGWASPEFLLQSVRDRAQDFFSSWFPDNTNDGWWTENRIFKTLVHTNLHTKNYIMYSYIDNAKNIRRRLVLINS